MTNKHIQYINEDINLENCSWGYRGLGWYFWDETEAYCYGPYDSKQEAEIELKRYAKTL